MAWLELTDHIVEVKKMTASELKYQIEKSGHEPYYFTRDTMRFFGDTMRNYGVRSSVVFDFEGTKHLVWELYRKSPVKHNNQSSAYFEKETYKRVFEHN